MRRGLTGKSQQSQKSRNAEQAQLGAHHQLAPIHRVGEQPADEQQRDLRQRARDAEQTDLQGRVGQFIDLPGHRHRSELRADAGQKRAGPEHTKVAMTQQRKPALVVIHSSINRRDDRRWIEAYLRTSRGFAIRPFHPTLNTRCRVLI